MSARSQLADVVSAQGHYAGAVSRLLAYLIDAAVSTALFALGLGATSLAVQVITGHSVHWTRANIAVAIIFALWEFFYFGYSWAASGRTFGMAVLGVRVVAVDGTALAPWRGALRALVFPLSFLLFGLGFLGILVQREHRALHDLIAGSVVIYAWDARAARLRFLAREAEVSAGTTAEGPATGGVMAAPGPAAAPLLADPGPAGLDSPVIGNGSAGGVAAAADPGGEVTARPSATGDAPHDAERDS
ncbi:MAG: RDD family protein [Streptosporangiaceae bacterium]|jgi:uncharacterized RDD family membrane protein YckC